MTVLQIPSSVETINSRAFAASGLVSFTIPVSFLNYRVRYGDRVELRMKSDVTLRYGLFADCKKLQKVSIPYGITDISDSVFEGCSSLTTVAIPSTVTHIGKKAFKGSGLVQIRLPESVRYFGTGAFSDCFQLRKVELSEMLRNNVRQYGNSVFPAGVEMVYY